MTSGSSAGETVNSSTFVCVHVYACSFSSNRLLIPVCLFIVWMVGQYHLTHFVAQLISALAVGLEWAQVGGTPYS